MGEAGGESPILELRLPSAADLNIKYSNSLIKLVETRGSFGYPKVIEINTDNVGCQFPGGNVEVGDLVRAPEIFTSSGIVIALLVNFPDVIDPSTILAAVIASSRIFSVLTASTISLGSSLVFPGFRTRGLRI